MQTDILIASKRSMRMGKSKNKKAVRFKKEQSGRHIKKNLNSSRERKEIKNAMWWKEEEREGKG